jgi:hypothetical protein
MTVGWTIVGYQSVHCASSYPSCGSLDQRQMWASWGPWRVAGGGGHPWRCYGGLKTHGAHVPALPLAIAVWCSGTPQGWIAAHAWLAKRPPGSMLYVVKQWAGTTAGYWGDCMG